jgi:hypothetical protein
VRPAREKGWDAEARQAGGEEQIKGSQAAFNEIEGTDRGLTQQGEHGLRHLVGLRQHRRTGLLQDLRAGHIGHFRRVVRILDSAAGVGQGC